MKNLKYAVCVILYFNIFKCCEEDFAVTTQNAFNPYISSASDMQCNCMMGVFPEISRAWLTIDSDIFMWNYEDGYVKDAFLMLFYWYYTRSKQLEQLKDCLLKAWRCAVQFN